jgi:hypothetical protein
MKNLSLLIILGISNFTLIYSQQTNQKESRKLKNHILNNTDHFYFGVETGVLFDFSQGKATDPNFNNQPYNSYLGDPFKDLLITANGRLIIGSRYKSHYFEIAFASYHSIFKRTAPPYVDPSQRVIKYFGAIQFGYYYRLPIKSPFYSLCMGPEIGIAFNYAWDIVYYDYDSNYPPELEFTNSYPSPLFGGSIRNEFKIKKNLTLFLRLSANYIWLKYAPVRYMYGTSSSGSPTYTSFMVYPINLALSFGLKFDFYSKKKKKQTFDQLGIEDPYKTQLYK